MIQMICKDGQFLVKGTFSVGIAGVYENKDFGSGSIRTGGGLEDVLRDLARKPPYFYGPLLPDLKDAGTDGRAIARGLEAYYNRKEAELQTSVKQVNDCILFNLFSDLEDCAYPFWEIKEAVIPGSLDGYDPDSLEKIIYGAGERADHWYKDFWHKPNNGTLEKVDVEGRLRRMYPMFNFDGLYQSIIQELLVLNGASIEFQFSDGWGAKLLEGAYDRFDENFTSCDWKNH